MAKPTFFQTGPEKVVPVSGVLNGYTPIYPEKDNGFKTINPDSSSIKKPVNVAEVVKAVKVDKDGNTVISSTDALKKLRDAVADTGNPTNGLNDNQVSATLRGMGVEDSIPGRTISNGARALTKVSRSILNRIDGSIDLDNASVLIRNGDMNSVNGVVGVINKLSGGSVIKVNDFNSKLSLINGVMNDLNKYGIIDAIDYILDSMADTRDKKRLMAKLVPMFFMTADIDNLNRAIKVLGAGKVMAIYPTGISMFCSSFRYPWVTEPKQFPKYRNAIISLFNKLNSDWNVYVRNGVKINNYECLTYMSDHFSKLFKFFDHTKMEHDIFPASGLNKEQQMLRMSMMVLSAKNFPSVNVENYLSRRYPKASFTFRRQT